MRISGIQNFITNNINKVNQNSSNSVNNSTKNNLERSPMQDTVSFGEYSEKHANFVQECMTYHLLAAGELGIEFPLMMSDYLVVSPTEDTLLDPKRGKCRLRFATADEVLKATGGARTPRFEETYIRRMNELLTEFNNNWGYEPGWEKELDKPEDYVKAARFAQYVERHPYFSGDSGSSFHREDVDVLNFYDRGLSL